MDFYIARQPIFTVNKRLFAYELLYRGYQEYTIQNVDGNKATTSLLSTAFFTEGIGKISGNKPCFINFTEDLLFKKIALNFPKSQVVVEVLEGIEPSTRIIDCLKELKKEGYTIALDDFVYDRSLRPLVNVADIIKIDVRLTPLDTIHKTLAALSRYKVKLLAEKVESNAEFEKANKLGFQYFQGYFFSKPEKILVKEIEATKISLFNLMSEVARKKTTLERLNDIISKDLSISYKLLRFLNSAYFYRLEKVRSVKHAIAYLGEKELRRFIILVIVSELAIDKPGELIRQSLVRAKFCELLAQNSNYAEYELEVFLVGMFSLMDAMLDTKMSVLMEKLPVIDMVKEALVAKKGVLAPFLRAVIYYERRKPKEFSAIMRKIGIRTKKISELYVQAINYSNGMI